MDESLGNLSAVIYVTAIFLDGIALAATDGSTEYNISRRLVNAAGMDYIRFAIQRLYCGPVEVLQLAN